MHGNKNQRLDLLDVPTRSGAAGGQAEVVLKDDGFIG
jgi:hypothetical protein